MRFFFPKYRITKLLSRFMVVALISLFCAALSNAQDWVKGGVGLAALKIRLAVPDFKASSQDPKNVDLLKTFNDTLWNDLDDAGMFDMASKSL